MANLVQPLRPFMEFVLDNRQLTKEAYDFLYAMFLRVGGSLSNLNAAFLQNATWQEPNAIGVVTPNQGKFTTLESTTTLTAATMIVNGTSTFNSNISTGADFVATNVGSGLVIKAGTNCRLGRSVLVAGTATVSHNNVTAADTDIFLTCRTPGGTPGFLRVSSIVEGVSFTITSSSATDTSTVAWLLVEQI